MIHWEIKECAGFLYETFRKIQIMSYPRLGLHITTARLIPNPLSHIFNYNNISIIPTWLLNGDSSSSLPCLDRLCLTILDLSRSSRGLSSSCITSSLLDITLCASDPVTQLSKNTMFCNGKYNNWMTTMDLTSEYLLANPMLSIWLRLKKYLIANLYAF